MLVFRRNFFYYIKYLIASCNYTFYTDKFIATVTKNLIILDNPLLEVILRFILKTLINV